MDYCCISELLPTVILASFYTVRNGTADIACLSPEQFTCDLVGAFEDILY